MQSVDMAFDASFAAWDPFADASDTLAGRRTEYTADDGEGQSAFESRTLDDDWDPFEDHDMLQLTGEIAMQSDDIDAIEAWIEQARAAQLPGELIQPMLDRVGDLKWRREDDKNRRVVKEKLEEALKGSDRGKLRETIDEAVKTGVAHPRKLDAAKQHLEEMRQAEAEYFRKKDIEDLPQRDKANEELAEEAKEKLWKARLVPSRGADLSDEERAALERAYYKETAAPEAKSKAPNAVSVRFTFPSGLSEVVEAFPADRAAQLLVKLFPFQKSHEFPENLGLFLASGEALKLQEPLEAQGAHPSSEFAVRVDDARLGSLGAGGSPQDDALPPATPEPPAAPEPTGEEEALEEEEEEEEQEGEEDEEDEDEVECAENNIDAEGWQYIYWPITQAKPPFKVMYDMLRRHGHDKVVVLGWNATGDRQVMKDSLQMLDSVQGDIFIVTGPQPPAKGSLPDGPVQSAYLKLDPHAENEDVGRTVRDGVEEAGADGPHVLVVVSRTYQNKRLVTAIERFNKDAAAKDPQAAKVAVLPYCRDPQATAWPDCCKRKRDILLEAQLFVEMDHTVFDAPAEAAFERLLTAYPTERPTVFPLSWQPPKKGARAQDWRRLRVEEAHKAQWKIQKEERERARQEQQKAQEEEQARQKAREEEQARQARKAQEEEQARLEELARKLRQQEQTWEQGFQTEVELASTDGGTVLFKLNQQGELDFYVNGELQMKALSSVNVWGGRRINIRGTAAVKKGPSTRATTIPQGWEAAAQHVEELFRRRGQVPPSPAPAQMSTGGRGGLDVGAGKGKGRGDAVTRPRSVHFYGEDQHVYARSR